MEKNLSYGLMLSLKEISLRRVVVILWSQRDILSSIYNLGVEQKVEDNISKLNLPPLLWKEMMRLVKPIGIEIRDWNQIHQQFLSKSPRIKLIHIDIPILERLCWTVFGAIDYRKSAEIIILHEMLDIVEIYILACFYCLDDYIPVLWEKLPDESKRYFYREEFLQDTAPEMEFCWPFIIKGEKTKLDSLVARSFSATTFNQYAFEYSANEGIKAATEYFFGKLTNAEKESSLLRAAKEVVISRSGYTDEYQILFFGNDEGVHAKKYSSVFCYLLSLMNHKQNMELMCEYPCKVLICLLDWPWQDIFLDIADLVWHFLTAIDYVYLLNRIAYKFGEGFHLTKVFHDFFLHGSSDFKKYFVDQECQYFFCFSIFFDTKEFDTIKLIFINVDSADRKRLMSSSSFLEIFYLSLLDGYQRWVEMCLQEAKLSKEDKELLKKSFLEFLKTNYPESIRSRENMWEKFCCLVDESEEESFNYRNSA